MIRKGNSNFEIDQCHRSETPVTVCKTPRVVLERLNIPQDSVVLVKGDSIVYPLDALPNKESQVSNVIDITISDDDDDSDDVDFQEIVIKRFQATHSTRSISQTSSNTLEARKMAQQSISKIIPPSPKSQKVAKVVESSTHSKSLNDIKRMPKVYGNLKKLELQKKHNQFTNLSKKSVESENLYKKVQIESTREKSQSVGSHCTEGVISSPPHSKNNFKGTASIDVNKSFDSSSFRPSKSTIVNNSDDEGLIGRSEQSNEDENESTTNVQQIASDYDEKSTQDTPEAPQNTSLVESLPSVSPSHEGDHASTPQSHQRDDIKAEFTPSRISQRIRNKKEKFSALKLLAGGNINFLKKELRESDLKKHPSPKRIFKTKVGSTADINANNSNIQSINFKEFRPMSALVRESTVTLPEKKKSPLGTRLLKDYKQDDMSAATKSLESEKLEGNNKHCEEQNVNAMKDKSSDSGGLVTSKPINKSAGSTNKINESQLASTKESSTKENEQICIKEVSDKVRLQLRGNPEKKVVNISISPKKELLKNQSSRKLELKQKLEIGLGPDIVIKRVRCDKSKDNNDKVEKEVINNGSLLRNIKETEPNISLANDLTTGSLKVKNLIYPEASVQPGTNLLKEVEVPLQIKKFLLETSKNKKKSSDQHGGDSSSNQSNNGDDPDFNLASNSLKKRKKMLNARNRKARLSMQHSKGSSVVGRKNKDDGRTDDEEVENFDRNGSAQSRTIQNEEGFESIDITGDSPVINPEVKKGDPNLGENKRSFKQFVSVSSMPPKLSEKKTAKVTPLRQVNKVQPRSELIKRNSIDKTKINNKKETLKYPKSKSVPKLGSSGELGLLGNKRRFANAFDKYFICSEKICEHYDSLDSDSSDDAGFLSHFIDLSKKHKNNEDETNDITNDGFSAEEISSELEHNIEAGNSLSAIQSRLHEDYQVNMGSQEKRTINEVIKTIISDLPRWNLHATPESSTVSLIVLDRSASGTLDVQKCIEIDCNFKVNVFVNKTLVNEYCGVYDNFDAIKNLIYQLDLL